MADPKELPPQTSGKAWASGVAGVVVTVGSILALVPENVRAQMGVYDWGVAIVGAFALCFASTWITKNYGL